MYITRFSQSSTQVEDSELRELREERESNSLPFSKSPFLLHGSNVEMSEDGELQVKVADDVPWTDLLLEIAMTTAFASLTDGTPILTKQALLSYLSFFILVWWIWASQVAYNLRFRQTDWLHRIFVFLQLGVFSALAAFTRKFDITAGLLPDDDETLADSLMLQLGDDQNSLQADQFREDRLPRLNARGVAMTMALSRLLLLVQYVVVCYHARRFTHRALVAHMAPLALSTLCFLISFAIIGSDASSPVPKSIEIAKLALWYIPMVFEIVSYFLAHELRGRIAYPKEGVISRSGTVFIITLGGGLDKITKGFQFIVGNTGLGIDGAGVFASAAVILVAQFSLYFGSPGGMRRLRGHRGLAWFFAHFFYLAALIMTLQGVATSLAFSNINHAIQVQTSALAPARLFMQDHPGVNISASDFPQSQVTFEKLGLSFPGVIGALNDGLQEAREANDTNISDGVWMQQSLQLLSLVLESFEAQPEPSSLLWAKTQVFLTATPNNTTEVNMANWWDIYDGIVRSTASSVLWFFPVAGCTLITLAVLSLIRGRPRDAFEMASIASRLCFGIGVVFLSLLDIHSSDPVVDANGIPTSSLIWVLTWKNWVLPLFAFAVAGLSLIEFVLAYLANRQYYSFRPVISPFRQSVSRTRPLDERTLGPYHELVTQPQRAAIVSTPSEASMYHMGRYYPSLQQSPSDQPSPTLPPSSPPVQYSPTLGHLRHPPLPSFYQRPSFNNSETSFQYAPDRV